MNFISNNIKIYTDGACSGNPGKGAFSYIILIDDNEIKRYCNGFIKTTNNRMELMAIIEAIKFIKSVENINNNSNIDIYSDSKYVVDSINKKWLNNWILKNFKNVKNVDLWKEYLNINNKFNVNFIWVEGHSNVKYNEICDKLATNFIKNGNLSIDEGYNG